VFVPAGKTVEEGIMTGPTIRELTDTEVAEVMYRLDTYAFSASPPLPDKDAWQERFKQRKGPVYVAAVEDGTVMATVAHTPLRQHVRGALFPMGGIMGVVTHPAARHKGYSRRCLCRVLEGMREQGRRLSCLYPFRESFYERLGYTTFPQARAAHFATAALAPLLKTDLGGEVELLLIGEGYETYRAYLRKLQRRVHGLALFEADQSQAAQRNTAWLAVAKVEGAVVGLMLYQIKGEKITQFVLHAPRFYYDTSQARYLLLQWIGRHADQATQVEIWLPPFELPETWLSDLEIKPEVQYFTPMGRVVDVSAMGGLRTGPGRIVARLSDPLCPWNEGVWQLETVDGALQVSPGGRAECTLTIQALSALVYGTHDPEDFCFRGWGDPTPEAQAMLRSLFPPQLPYLHEFF
jgi:predicted acetyltransferase